MGPDPKTLDFAFYSSAPKYEHFPVFGLSSSYNGWAKCKEKVSDVSDLNQNFDTSLHDLKNSSLHNLKIYSSKAGRKTSQR